MPSIIALIILLLTVCRAEAFDTKALGQGGSLSLSDIKPLLDKSPRLKKEIDEALAVIKKSPDDVICSGRRFPGQWEQLGGERVSPYSCDFGGKWLVVHASVRLIDDSGRAYEAVTRKAMKNASKVSETNITWNWATEDPFKDE
jgi:hypothetical protein